MITQDCIRVLQFNLRLCSRLSDSPFKWEKAKNNLRTIDGKPLAPDAIYKGKFTLSQGPRKFWYFRHIVLWIHTIFLVSRLIYVGTLGKGLTVVGLIEYLMWLTAYGAVAFCGLGLIRVPEEHCLLANQIVHFWKERFPQQFATKRGWAYHVLGLYLGAAMAIPLVLPVIFWLMPCAPQFLYSVVSQTCTVTRDENDGMSEDSRLSNRFINFGIRLIFYCMEVYLITPVTDFAGLSGNILILGLAGIHGILTYMRKMGSLFIVNRVLSPGILQRRSYQQGLLYRQVQLLVNLLNCCFMEYLFPVMFISHATYNVMSLFAVLELKVRGDSFVYLLAYFMYPFMLVVVVACDMFLLECASRPMSLSKLVKHKWRKWLYNQPDNPWLRKFSKSCPTLKIMAKPGITIGRERLAIFLRFCLQRAFFFVVYHRNRRIA